MTRRFASNGFKPAIIIVLAASLAGCNTLPTQSSGPTRTSGGGASACAFGSPSSNTDARDVMSALAGVGAVVALLSGNRKLAAILGGGVLGLQIWKQLSPQEQQCHAANVQAAAQSGRARSWTNPDTGAKGEVKVLRSYSEPRRKRVAVAKDRVQETPDLDYIGETYIANRGANVRGGPLYRLCHYRPTTS